MKTITAMPSILLFAGLAACKIAEGNGEDVEDGGKAICNIAQETEQVLSK